MSARLCVRESRVHTTFPTRIRALSPLRSSRALLIEEHRVSEDEEKKGMERTTIACCRHRHTEKEREREWRGCRLLQIPFSFFFLPSLSVSLTRSPSSRVFASEKRVEGEREAGRDPKIQGRSFVEKGESGASAFSLSQAGMAMPHAA